MKVLFISDLHLCDERPETIRAFLAFLRTTAPQANALYILGDLFEYWAGDDDDSPLGRLVAEQLGSLSENGTRVYFLAGNRDFLLGRRFAERAGLKLLVDPTLIEIDGSRILLSHGDELCTDDISYQTYRKEVRAPAWCQGFLDKPLAERKQFIEQVRQKSEIAKSGKRPEIMDVNPDAVAALLRGHDFPTLIHGHTHRPARHVHIVDDKHCERWVLADWHDEACYLAWENSSLTAHCLNPPRQD